MSAETPSEPYAFEVLSEGRDKEVLYRVGSHELRIHLEIVLAKGFDYGATTQNFETWDVPQGQALTASEVALAHERLKDWGLSKKRIRISIERGLSRDEQWAEMEAQGWSRSTQPDSTELWSPPPPRNAFERFFRWFVS